MSIPGLDGAYALGDTTLILRGDGKPLPGLAQVAKQQGTHSWRALVVKPAHDTPLPPFRFRNRGNTAIIGRSAAVFDFGRTWKPGWLKGWLAWILWAIVHVHLLVGFEKRLLVSLQWLWRYLIYERGARPISAPPLSAPSAAPPERAETSDSAAFSLRRSKVG